MEAIELEGAVHEHAQAVIDGEPAPWGTAGAALSWAEKTRHVGILAADGRPLALAGVVIARVAVGSHAPFEVVGVGGVIVTRSRRGEGLATPLLEGVMGLAARLGPAHAMLFCRDELSGLYARHGFRPIGSPVTAEQPGGLITVPMGAMWAPLAPDAQWPTGDVAVIGEPF